MQRLHRGYHNRRLLKACRPTGLAISLFLLSWQVPVCLKAAPGLSYRPLRSDSLQFILTAPQKDSVITFDAGRLIAPATPPTRARSPWALDLGPTREVGADSLDLQTYIAFRNQNAVVGGWNTRVTTLLKQSDAQKRGALKIGLALPSAMESIVGEGGAGLKVSGYRRILFSGRSQWTDAANVAAIRQSRFPSLTMQQDARFTVEGTVGSKISVKVDQDSKRTTDLENRIILRYKGDDDDVLQSVDLGNTTLSLSDARFVGYSQQIQGLFGISAGGKVGPVGFKVIASQEKGNTTRSRLTAGANEQSIIVRDYSYDRYRFFDLARIGDSTYWKPGDSIIAFNLFISAGSIDPNNPQAVAYPNWRDRTGSRDSVVQQFRQLSLVDADGRGDYVLVPGQFYVWFPTRLQNIQNQTLAYYMEIDTNNDKVPDAIFGDLSGLDRGEPLRLQLLKRSSPSPDDGLWNAEWKNVYDLRIRNIDYNDLTLDIYKGQRGDEDNRANPNSNDDGTQFLQVLGLDSVNATGQSNPDNKVDDNPTILNRSAGLLIFPNRYPFADVAALGTDTVSALYNTAENQRLLEASKYYIKITTRQRSRTLRLGAINILEGSEVVTYNNTRLNRGSDYDIDYNIGEITFLRDEVLDATANVTIDYEYSPFISAEKRSLFGASLRYDAGQSFRTGTTVLYKGTKATDRPAQLGQEPYRDLVAEQFLNWSVSPTFLTRVADAIPLVKTEAPSRIDFQGAVARSIPNPNTKDQVYVDDFEGAKRAQSLGVLRETWSIASPPSVDQQDPSLTLPTRGFHDPGFIWFNPYTQFEDIDVYDRDPERNRASDRRIHVLVLESRPQKSRTIEPGTDPKSAWGGIMRGLPGSAQIQSGAEYLEFRMAVAAKGHTPGVLHLDLGRISEDVDGGGTLSTEDQERGVPPFRNRILDADEDTGLDGVPDSLEQGYDPVNNPDPAGDNWDYDNSIDRRNDYERINGTEKNVRDPVRGVRPDTEDLGGESEFDQINRYYEFAVHLDDPLDPALVPNSEKVSGDKTGFAEQLVWKTYRIPLWDSRWYTAFADAGGKPDSNKIQFARMWLSGADSTTRIYFAAVDIVERTWESSMRDADSSDIYIHDRRKGTYPDAATTRRVDPGPTPAFQLGVVNTEENKDYFSPPGVSGYRDPRTRFTEKEQSLLLKYDNFMAGDVGRATILPAKEDFTGYRYLRLFVHADSGAADGRMAFYFRFGQNASDYYEYLDTLVYDPDHDRNWEANAVTIDFDRLTAIKEDTTRQDSRGNYNYFDTASHNGVYGNPSLANIAYRELGLVGLGNGSEPPRSGNVWIDELRLTGVRKDPGLAASGRMTFQMADLFGFTAVVEGQNYAFRQLTQGRTSSVLAGATRVNLTLNGTVNLHKFLPEALGATLPVAVNATRNTTTPRLKAGSDIVLTRAGQESEQATLKSVGVSFPIQVRPKTHNWLVNSTIGAVTLRFNAGRSWSRTPPTTLYSKTETYQADAGYSLKFKERLTFPALFWTRFLLLPRRVYGTPLSILPTTFSASGSVARTSGRIRNNKNVTTDTYTRTFRGNSTVALQPIPALSASYDMSTQRDLSDPELVKLSVNPRELRLGNELNFTQRLTSNYRPQLFSFFSPSFAYSATFADNIDRVWRDHDVSVDRNWSANGTFDLQKFLNALSLRRSRPPTQARPSSPQRRESAGPASGDDAKKDTTTAPTPKPSGQGGFVAFGAWDALLSGLRWLTSPIGAMSLSYGRSDRDARQNLANRPSQFYQFGWRLDELVPRSATGIQGTGQVDSRSRRETYGVKNQLNFFKILTFGSSYGFSRTQNVTAGSRTRAEGTEFPSLTTGLQRLERFKPLGWVFSTASASFGYTRKKEKSYQNDDLNGNTVTEDFRPLLRIVGSTRKGLQVTMQWDRGSSTNEPRFSAAKTKGSSSGMSLTTNYTFSSPNGIPLPILRAIRLRSQMSLSVTLTRKTGESLSAPVGSDAFQLTQSNTDFGVSTSARYSFSTRLSGGMSAEWTDRSENSQSAGRRKSHVRSLALWAEFTF
ncbi:MAG: cell surface protein SprA [Candidatus Zixiibacteriota bacterium]